MPDPRIAAKFARDIAGWYGDVGRTAERKVLNEAQQWGREAGRFGSVDNGSELGFLSGALKADLGSVSPSKLMHPGGASYPNTGYWDDPLKSGFTTFSEHVNEGLIPGFDMHSHPPLDPSRGAATYPTQTETKRAIGRGVAGPLAPSLPDASVWLRHFDPNRGGVTPRPEIRQTAYIHGSQPHSLLAHGTPEFDPNLSPADMYDTFVKLGNERSMRALLDKVRNSPSAAGVTHEYGATTPELWAALHTNRLAKAGVPMTFEDRAPFGKGLLMDAMSDFYKSSDRHGEGFEQGGPVEMDTGGGVLRKLIRAYHSSPYAFDKFDATKIGSGEGAQSYGHGHYFAEHPDISGKGGHYWNQFLGRMPSSERDPLSYLTGPDYDRQKGISIVEDQIRRNAEFAASKHYTHPEDLGDAERTSQRLEAIKQRLADPRQLGPTTYEVGIHQDPASFLQQHIPFDEQGATGRRGFDALRELDSSVYRDPDKYQDYKPDYFSWILDPSFAKEAGARGVPGMQYPDAVSRKWNEGTRNTIVFPSHEDSVEILKKYADGGPVDTPTEGDGGIYGAPDSMFNTPESLAAALYPQHDTAYGGGGKVLRKTGQLARAVAPKAEDIYGPPMPPRWWERLPLGREGLEVAINPAHDDLVRLGREDPNGGVRLLRNGRDVYGWRAEDALHYPVARHLGVTQDISNSELLQLDGSRFLRNVDGGADLVPDNLHRWLTPDTNKAEGGPVHMEVGGILRRASRLGDMMDEITNRHGASQGRRFEQASDSANLEHFSDDALRQTFGRSDTGLYTTMPPGRFEDFAAPIPDRIIRERPYYKWGYHDDADMLSPNQQSYDEYMRVLKAASEYGGGLDGVPYLNLKRGLPFNQVEGHEGRHRMRMFDEQGDKNSLVHLKPTGGYGLFDDRVERLMKHYFPRGRDTPYMPERSDVYDAFRPMQQFPNPIFAEGGEVEMAGGGADKIKDAVGFLRRNIMEHARQESKVPPTRDIESRYWDHKKPPNLDTITADYADHPPVDVPTMKIEDTKGGRLFAIPHDRSATDITLGGYNGNMFADPVTSPGGPLYAFGRNPEAVTASGESVIKKLHESALRSADDGRTPYLAPWLMGPHGVDFSTHMNEAVVQSLPFLKVPSAKKDEVNAMLSTVFKDFPGIDHKDLVQYLHSMAGTTRRDLPKLLDKGEMVNAGLDVGGLRAALTEPSLLHAPYGSSGAAISRIDPSKSPTMFGYPNHPSYPWQLQGTPVGGLDPMVPPQILYPDFFRSLPPETQLGPKGKPVNNRRAFEMSSMKGGVGQDVNDEVINKVNEYQEYMRNIRGRKEGGTVEDQYHPIWQQSFAAGGQPETLDVADQDYEYQPEGHTTIEGNLADALYGGRITPTAEERRAFREERAARRAEHPEGVYSTDPVRAVLGMLQKQRAGWQADQAEMYPDESSPWQRAGDQLGHMGRTLAHDVTGGLSDKLIAALSPGDYSANVPREEAATRSSRDQLDPYVRGPLSVLPFALSPAQQIKQYAMTVGSNLAEPAHGAIDWASKQFDKSMLGQVRPTAEALYGALKPPITRPMWDPHYSYAHGGSVEDQYHPIWSQNFKDGGPVEMAFGGGFAPSGGGMGDGGMPWMSLLQDGMSLGKHIEGGQGQLEQQSGTYPYDPASGLWQLTDPDLENYDQGELIGGDIGRGVGGVIGSFFGPFQPLFREGFGRLGSGIGAMVQGNFGEGFSDMAEGTPLDALFADGGPVKMSFGGGFAPSAPTNDFTEPGMPSFGPGIPGFDVGPLRTNPQVARNWAEQERLRRMTEQASQRGLAQQMKPKDSGGGGGDIMGMAMKMAPQIMSMMASHGGPVGHYADGGSIPEQNGEQPWMYGGGALMARGGYLRGHGGMNG